MEDFLNYIIRSLYIKLGGFIMSEKGKETENLSDVNFFVNKKM